MTRHPYTPTAKPFWDGIPRAAQERILDNVWCGNCLTSRRISDFTGVTEDGNVRLQGFCTECGHVFVRIIETFETS